MNINMKHNHIVGSDEWKEHVIAYLSSMRDAFMAEGRDMKAMNLDMLITEMNDFLNLPHRTNERKN